MWTRWKASRAAPTHEDFKPLHDWIRDEGSDDILLVNLPGFKKEQLRVQLDNCGNMKISGELPTNGNKQSRFLLEFHVPEGCNLHEIRARFENGILSVTMPKMTNRVEGVQDQQPTALVEAFKSDSKTNVTQQEKWAAAAAAAAAAATAAAAPRKTHGDMTKENDLVVKIDRPMDGRPFSYRCKLESCECCMQASVHGFKKMSVAIGQCCCCCTSGDCKCCMGISISGLNKPKKMSIDVGPSSSYCKSEFYVCGMDTSPHGLSSNPMKIAASVLVASMLVALGSYGAYKVRS